MTREYDRNGERGKAVRFTDRAPAGQGGGAVSRVCALGEAEKRASADLDQRQPHV